MLVRYGDYEVEVPDVNAETFAREVGGYVVKPETVVNATTPKARRAKRVKFENNQFKGNFLP